MDSDINRCNEQFWRLYDGFVAAKVWRGAKELGILGPKDDAVHEKAIQAMEERDHNVVTRGHSNKLP